MVRIAGIEKGSIADELEIEIGTRIVRINGERVRDNIDLTFLLSDTELELEAVSPGGETILYDIIRDAGDPIGIVPTPDAIRECANECVFCFIDGNPEGVRPSLWLRDDDFRLSFTYGSYVTLTNLGPKGIQRLIDQRMLDIDGTPDKSELGANAILGVSLAVLDEELQQLLEPGTPTPRARLDLVRSIREAGLDCHVMVAPVLACMLTLGFIALRSLRRLPPITDVRQLASALERHTAPPPSRVGPALKVHWIILGAFVTTGVVLTALVLAVYAGHRLELDFAAVNTNDVRANGPLVLLGTSVLAAFPVAGYLIAKASGAASVLEPAMGAALAIIGVLGALSIAAPVAVVFALAVAPVAFGLACAGAWFAIER